MSGFQFPEDCTYKVVETGIPGGVGPNVGTLLLQLPDQGDLPMLQIFDSTASSIKLVRRWRREPGRIEHTVVWLDDDVSSGGPFEQTERRARADIEADIRSFCGPDPRADALIACLPVLPW